MSVRDSSASALLQPTLSDAAPPQPLLSEQATFLTSFFGGPWAALWMMMSNYRRLGRVQAGIPALAFTALLGVAALVFTCLFITRPDLVDGWAPAGGRASSLVRRANNLLGLLGWGACYLQLRPHYRAASISGLGVARPWGTVAGAILTAIVVHGVVVGIAYALR